jgi:REP element-mobilizing transposase RayT
MNRGRRGEKVFEGKNDYNAFIDLLKELVEDFNVNIAAYCLLSNHYHLLVQTPDANKMGSGHANYLELLKNKRKNTLI